MVMKDSRVPWIGEIPYEWKIRPVKSQYSLTTGFTPSSEDDSLYDDDGETWVTISDLKSNIVTDSKQKIAKSVAQKHLKEIAKAGSLLYSFKLSVGTVAFAGKDLYTNEAIAAFQPVSKDADLHFLKYASSLIIGNANTNIYGAAIMNQKLILNAPLPVPSLSEQQAIASYLDDRCSKLDEIITEAEKSIEEYKELKQAVIANAVLCGIDRAVPVRNTGENWCQTIPTHWRFERGRYLFKETNIRSVDGSEELLTVSQYTGITPRSMKNVTMFEATSLVDYKICDIGDIAANTMWMWAGAVGVSEYYGVISPSYNTYRQIKGDYNPKYLDYLLRAFPLVSEYESLSTGIRASRLRLYPSQFLSIRYPVPPLAEQKSIVEYLDRRVGDMDALISEKQSLIEDLQAYKKSLIYEVVTGKRRVV